MILHSSKRWYIHLLYYQVLKFFRFFTNKFFARSEHKFLFILTPPYCGSTLLNQIISTSNNVSCNNHLGVREGQLLPELKDIMFYNKGWYNDVTYDWVEIKKVWMKYWDQRKVILMEQSDANIMRVTEIKKVFNNIVFLVMVRNPYAHIEGLIRRNGITTESATKLALRCLKYQKNNIENEEHVLLLTYEDLCDKKYDSVKKIQEFIPELGKIDVDRKFSAHNFMNKGKMEIQNLNNQKISNLSREQIGIINSYLTKEKELLKYFGYSIIE